MFNYLFNDYCTFACLKTSQECAVSFVTTGALFAVPLSSLQHSSEQLLEKVARTVHQKIKQVFFTQEG